MDQHEWNELNRMHHEITASGIQSFNAEYLEQYTALLTKSLQGKGNPNPNKKDQ